MSVRSFQRAHARRQAREQRRASTLRRKGSLIAGLALSSSALFAANAQAATYTVTGNTDAAGTCTANSCTTLRAAITQANTDGTADTITFDPSVASPITLTSALPTISDAGGLTIAGPGASALTIDANHVARVFDLAGPTTTPNSITGLTLTNGTSSSAGGAVYNSSKLTLTTDVISNSATSNSGGGGGIFSNGPVTMSGTTLSGNSSPNSGGGIRMNSGHLTITGSTISGNTAVNRGGGIAGGNATYITDSHITGNTTTGSNGQGGGISSAYDYLSLKGSTVSGNTSVRGGGMYLGTARYGTVVDNSTVSGNTASSGGGVLIDTNRKYAGTVQLESSTVSGNQATNGAGIDVSYIGAPSPVTIQSSTLSGNTGGPNSFGGGLLVEGDLYGSLDLLNSTVSGNSATIGGGVSLGNSSHYPLVTGRYAPTGLVSFDNSTIAANNGTAHAGGIYLGQYQTSPSSPYHSGTVRLASTIVGGNTAAGISDDLERGGSSTSGGFNGAFSLVQSPGNAPFVSKNAVITGIGPQLGPLADNGGPTQTMLPSGTSPVIDQGKSPSSLPTDQRGMPRLVDTAITNPPGGDGTDIGAVELPASSVVIPPPPPPPPPTPTSGITLSIRGASLSLSSRPLLVGNQTPVTCSVKAGTLNACVIEVRTGAGKLMGSGEVTSSRPVTSLTTRVTPTRAGLSYLKHRQLGVDATATLVASQSAAGSPVVTGNVHFLQGPSITLGLGKRSDSLSNNVVTELNRVAKLLAGTKSFTCTAYSDKGKADVTLTKSEAGAACTRLKKDGLTGKSRVVGRGHANPVASNHNRKGRAANRRLVISFTF